MINGTTLRKQTRLEGAERPHAEGGTDAVRDEVHQCPLVQGRERQLEDDRGGKPGRRPDDESQSWRLSVVRTRRGRAMMALMPWRRINRSMRPWLAPRP
jgi:hypothetical protein